MLNIFNIYHKVLGRFNFSSYLCEILELQQSKKIKMETIEIYLHGENCQEAKIIEIPVNSKIGDIIAVYHNSMNPDAKMEEIELFFEDDDDMKNKEHEIGQAGIKKRHHVHCHRCKKVTVTIDYNGQVIHLKVAPSNTGERILKLAAKEFKIAEGDIGDLYLKLPDGTTLDPDAHIGSYVHHPKCEITLTLINNNQVQG